MEYKYELIALSLIGKKKNYSFIEKKVEADIMIKEKEKKKQRKSQLAGNL